jgi:hypothetical protein
VGVDVLPEAVAQELLELEESAYSLWCRVRKEGRVTYPPTLWRRPVLQAKVSHRGSTPATSDRRLVLTCARPPRNRGFAKVELDLAHMLMAYVPPKRPLHCLMVAGGSSGVHDIDMWQAPDSGNTAPVALVIKMQSEIKATALCAALQECRIEAVGQGKLDLLISHPFSSPRKERSPPAVPVPRQGGVISSFPTICVVFNAAHLSLSAHHPQTTAPT